MRGMTHGVARLLHEDLGETDHVRVVVELFGEVDHSISRVLLITVPACSQKSRESLLRDRVTLLGTPSSNLKWRLVSVHV